MKNLFSDNEAKKYSKDPLAMRVYTSRLLGQEPDLVLHGGGNTSVKAQARNVFGELEDVLYIKGSGWDLATIDAAGFAPVKKDVLLKMARMPKLSDRDMVQGQRAAMLDPNAPTPSVEAILHAIIPYKFVDHTHADAVVAITNTPDGEKRIRDVYGKRLLYVPYVMPGFVLARKVFEMTQDIDWNSIEGILLMNHGIFTFDDEAKASYNAMIRLVSEAEKYLNRQHLSVALKKGKERIDLNVLAKLRGEISRVRGTAVVAKVLSDEDHAGFSNLKNIKDIAARGPLTPDHIIRTKQSALVLDGEHSRDLERYTQRYQKYFDRHTDGTLKRLDPAPRWAVWPGYGVVCFGPSVKDAQITADIAEHTIEAICLAEGMGGWKPLPEKDLFEVEYWELEQAKLKKNAAAPFFQGKIALVTGAASGIGRACVEALEAQGAAVAALDIDAGTLKQFQKKTILPLVCDLTDPRAIAKSVNAAVAHFGGLDILVSNAGIFPPSQTIADMSEEMWEKSLAVNLTGHQQLLKACVPFLTCGIDPAVVIVGSKNVPAPGPGASAYSVAKAGLTQMARIAALELGPAGIRVNVVHPNQVFDTAIWTPEVLQKRAKAYGLSVEEYKTSNVLKTAIESADVARLICAMAGPAFAKTTGAQVPIDGGNERVI